MDAKKMEWMKTKLQELAQDFKKAFPDAKHGEWQWYVSNTLHWD